MKKIAAAAALLVAISVVLCSCGGREEGSSTAVESSKGYSSAITSSEVSSEDTSSKNDSSLGTSSKDAASLESSSSKVQSGVSSKQPTSSVNVTSLIDYTESGEVIKNITPDRSLGIGAYNFNPETTTNYGTTEEDRLREFRDVIEARYFNSVMIPASWIQSDALWEICLKNKLQVWICCDGVFKSSQKSLNAYCSELFAAVDKLRSNRERWASFVGFHFEKPMQNGATNFDFLTETKTIYQKYGKRIFATVDINSFYDVSGQHIDVNLPQKKITSSGLKFVTDIAFEGCKVDVRESYGNGEYLEKFIDAFPEAYNGQKYFEEFSKTLVRLVGHEVNVWYLPCAYTTAAYNGERTDEAYCDSQLKFFNSLLMKQMFKGGLYLYSYDSPKSSQPGLENYIVVEEDYSLPAWYKILPNKKKWKSFSTNLRKITADYREMSVQQIYGL